MQDYKLKREWFKSIARRQKLKRRLVCAHWARCLTGARTGITKSPQSHTGGNCQSRSRVRHPHHMVKHLPPLSLLGCVIYIACQQGWKVPEVGLCQLPSSEPITHPFSMATGLSCGSCLLTENHDKVLA